MLTRIHKLIKNNNNKNNLNTQTYTPSIGIPFIHTQKASIKLGKRLNPKIFDHRPSSAPTTVLHHLRPLSFIISEDYNPGLNSEFVIKEGISQDYMRRNADPQTQFPIPNEREMRLSRGSNSSEPTGSRSIQFQPQSVTVAPPSDLPFQTRGLQWRGEPCLTTPQLLSRLRANNDKGKKAID